MVVLPLFFGGRPQPAAGSLIDFLLGDPFLLVQWTAAAVLVLWLVRIWLDPRPKLLWPPVCWAVLAFVIYALVRYRMCDIEYVGRQEFIKVVAYAFLFFAVLNNLHRQETIHLVGYTLVFLACALSFYAIYQFLTGSNRVWHLNKPYPHRA